MMRIGLRLAAMGEATQVVTAKRMGGRLAAIAAAGVAVVSMTGGTALAESRYCRQIQIDYLSADRAAPRSGGDTANLRRELGQVQSQAKRLGCQRFLFFGRKPSKQCPAVMSKLNRLQREVNRNSGSGFGLFGRRQASYQRDRLRDLLHANGCEIPSQGYGYAGSGYRTLCVRSCDGFYFPISFSTARSRFKIDEAVCKNFYGPAEAELYVHNNGSPSETSVSLKGQPYTSLPTALGYRSDFSLSCQAELHNGLAAIADAQEVRLARAEAEQKANPAAVLPAPIARLSQSEDPETLANLAGNFQIEPVAPEDTIMGAVADAESIRRLGPDYYYEQPVKLEGLEAKAPKPLEFSIIGTAHADERELDRSEPAETTVQ